MLLIEWARNETVSTWILMCVTLDYVVCDVFILYGIAHLNYYTKHIDGGLKLTLKFK